jgi:hypothetical protein
MSPPGGSNHGRALEVPPPTVGPVDRLIQLPLGMKLLFDPTRPDRRTVLGKVHGVSSGKRETPFLRSRAAHGALASAAGTLAVGPPSDDPRSRGRTLASRVVVLARWASDVAAGFAPGAILRAAAKIVDRLLHEDAHADS